MAEGLDALPRSYAIQACEVTLSNASLLDRLSLRVGDEDFRAGCLQRVEL